MSRGSANTAKKEGSERYYIESHHISLNDPATQMYAIHGDVENSPFRSCIDDLSEVEWKSPYGCFWNGYISEGELLEDESETAKKGYDMFMLHDMHEAAKQQIERQPIDIFHSPASFTMTSKGRLKSGIASMTTVCLDIDYHKTDEYCDHDPEEMASIIHKLCDDFSIPRPGMIVHSGGGLQTYWIFEPMRFSQHPHPSDFRRSVREVNCDRWMSVVRQLWSIFAPLGADHQGNNIVRLLRLVGSKSSRNGNEVRIVHLDRRLMIPGRKRDTFDDLELDIRHGIEENFDKIDHEGNEARKRGKRPDTVVERDLCDEKPKDDENAPAPISHEFGTTGNVVNLQSVRELQGHLHRSLKSRPGFGIQAQYRLNDMFKLIEGRHGGVIPEGFRNTYIYVISSLLAYLAPPAALEQRTHELAMDLCDGWTDKQTENTISSVMRRALEAEGGKTRILNGKIVDPRYWYNSENLCEFLNVSFEEMRAYDLRALVNHQRRLDNQRENWRNSKRNLRAKQPKTPEQLERERIKRELIILVQKLREDGLSNNAIVTETRLALNTVKKYLKMEIPEAVETPEDHQTKEDQGAAEEKVVEKAIERPQNKRKLRFDPLILRKWKKAQRAPEKPPAMPANNNTKYGPDIIEFDSYENENLFPDFGKECTSAGVQKLAAGAPCPF